MHVVRCNVGRGQAIVEQFSPLQTLNQDLLWWLKQYWYYKTKQYLNNQNMELVYCWYTLYGKQCLMFQVKTLQQRGDIHVSDKRPSFKTFDVVFDIGSMPTFYISIFFSSKLPTGMQHTMFVTKFKLFVICPYFIVILFI